jgi:hypothetical protein
MTRAGMLETTAARLAALLLATALLLLPASLRAAELADFFGVYVGTAEAEDLPDGPTELRDMDVIIQGFKEGGFRIDWVNVSLVDGRRDVPGVKRRAIGVLFEPSSDQDFFVEVQENNPFRVREETQPMQGDPVRWARIDGDTLQVCSFVVLDDGRYELQVYDRILTEDGMDIVFERIIDGEVVRRVVGHTVRAG